MSFAKRNSLERIADKNKGNGIAHVVQSLLYDVDQFRILKITDDVNLIGESCITNTYVKFFDLTCRSFIELLEFKFGHKFQKQSQKKIYINRIVLDLFNREAPLAKPDEITHKTWLSFQEHTRFSISTLSELTIIN